MQRDHKGFRQASERPNELDPDVTRTACAQACRRVTLCVVFFCGAILASACTGPGSAEAAELDPARDEGDAMGGLHAADGTSAMASELARQTTPASAPAEPGGAQPSRIEPNRVAPEPPFPSAGADSLLWRAGSGRLVGLPGASASQRARDRDEALAELGARLASTSPDREGWLFHLSARLGDNVPEQLWCATARTVGALGVYELGEQIAGGLAVDASPRRRGAAQDGLHALYGHWFVSQDEVEPYSASIAAGPGTALLVESLLAEEQRANERLFEVLRLDLAAGQLERQRAHALLGDPSPTIRAGVARLLGQAVGEGKVDAPELLDALCDRLELEVDSAAYAALLDAALVPLENAAPRSPELERFAGILSARVEAGARELGVPIAQTLARLPWDAAGADATVTLIGKLLAYEIGAERDRGILDPDSTVAVLQALEGLSRSLRGTPGELALRENFARAPVFAILSDTDRDEATRAAAGGAFDAFVRPEDGRHLLQVLLDSPPPAVAHALVRPLQSILLASDIDDPQAQRLTEAVARLAGHPDPDLRRGALRILGQEALEPRVGQLEIRQFVERLATEENDDLAIALLVLVRRFGAPELLGPMLALDSFPRLAAGDVRGELVAALGVLAAGAARPTFAAAEALAQVDDAETEIARTRRALSLIADLTDEAARSLSGDEHRSVGAWAAKLNSAGVPLDEAPLGADFVDRLIALHLPGSKYEERGAAGAVRFGEAERQHLLAVLLGQQVVAGRTTLSDDEVDASFERAAEFALSVPDRPELASLVRRDRARFHDAVGATLAALKGYRLLLAEPAADAVLDNADLRAAARLAGALDPTGTATSAETFAYLARLVERSLWRSEPGAVRVQDLAAVFEVALHSGKAELVAQAESYLVALPATVPENGNAVAADGRVWSGLERNSEWLTALQDLARGAAAAE